MGQWDTMDWAYTPSGKVVPQLTAKGAPMATKMVARLEGGAFLNAQLIRLEMTCRVLVSKQAVEAGGEVIAKEWRGRVHIEDHNYQKAIGVKPSRTKTGATASIAVRHLDSPVTHGNETADDAQPLNYASRQEFGESGVRRGNRTVGGSRRSFPSARPAFDHGKDGAVDAVADTLRVAIGAMTL